MFFDADFFKDSSSQRRLRAFQFVELKLQETVKERTSCNGSSGFLSQFFLKLAHLFATVDPYKSLFKEAVRSHPYDGYGTEGVLDDMFAKSIALIPLIYGGTVVVCTFPSDPNTKMVPFEALAQDDIHRDLTVKMCNVDFDITSFVCGGTNCIACAQYRTMFRSHIVPVLHYKPLDDIRVKERDFGYSYENANVLRMDSEGFLERKTETFASKRRALLQLVALCRLRLDIEKVVLLGSDFAQELAGKLSNGPYARYQDLIVLLLTQVVKKLNRNVTFDPLFMAASLMKQLEARSVLSLARLVSNFRTKHLDSKGRGC